MDLRNREGGSPADCLTAALRHWLAGQPSGSVLPSERQLAGELPVSRHSVRLALQRLQQAGLLARQGRKLVLARDPAYSRSAAHPLVASAGRPRRRRELTLAVIDDLPEQLAVWQRLVTDYNAGEPELPIAVCTIPRGIENAAALQRYLTATPIDLIQAPSAVMRGLQQAHLLTPLPPRLRELRNRPPLPWRDLAGSAVRRSLDSAIVVAVDAWMLLWDEDSLGPAPASNDLHTVIRELCRAAVNLPDGVSAMQAPLAAMVLAGYPPRPLAIDDARQITDDLLAIGSTLAAIRHRLSDLNRGDAPTIQNLLDGEVAALIAPSSEVLRRLPGLQRSVRAIMPEPLPGMRTPIDACLVAALAERPYSDQADHFLAYLLSPEAQRIIVADGLNLPILADAFALLPAPLRQPPGCSMESVAGAWRLVGQVEESWRYFLIQHVNDRLVGIMRGKADASDMGDIIRRAEPRYHAFTSRPARLNTDD